MTIALLTVFAAVVPVFAQQISEKNQSEYYYLNVPIEKIYNYRIGYIINYRQGINKLGTLYIPHSWFTDAAGKGELVMLAPGKDWPTLSVYYKEGEFSHCRLYIHRWKGHTTWGMVPTNINIDDRFEGIETLEIQY